MKVVAMQPVRPILLAEDDPQDTELTLETLSSHHLANTVVVVRDGAEAMDYLLHQGLSCPGAAAMPAVVLLDLKMPRMDGLETLQAIRSDERLCRLPVVILTSSRDEADRVRSERLGISGYMTKPLSFEEFVATVASLGVSWVALSDPDPAPVPCLR
jgi:CheY-like chemotaxis protein